MTYLTYVEIVRLYKRIDWIADQVLRVEGGLQSFKGHLIDVGFLDSKLEREKINAAVKAINEVVEYVVGMASNLEMLKDEKEETK